MKIKDKVLIVEDEQSISNFISMILTANGYDTIVVHSGEEALTMISSHCPDLIILDLGLPDMDGMFSGNLICGKAIICRISTKRAKPII